jgi:hypothetical protein
VSCCAQGGVWRCIFMLSVCMYKGSAGVFCLLDHCLTTKKQQ